MITRRKRTSSAPKFSPRNASVELVHLEVKRHSQASLLEPLVVEKRDLLFASKTPGLLL